MFHTHEKARTEGKTSVRAFGVSLFKKCRNHRRNKKRRKQKLAATSRSWFADLLKDILGGVATAISIKMLKLD